MSLIELAERVEKASGASFVLDRAISDAMGHGDELVRPYSASTEAAMSLVPEGAGLGIERYWNRHGEVWSAEIRTGGVPDNPRKVFDCYDAATPALALCAAALRARAQQEN